MTKQSPASCKLYATSSCPLTFALSWQPRGLHNHCQVIVLEYDLENLQEQENSEERCVPGTGATTGQEAINS
eukprot:1137257-Pelagomonas_calceolata.AAC.6